MQLYNHKEAFCLMTYQDDNGNMEILWNSRDGVTPFVITSRDGIPARHVNWPSDVCNPNRQPRVGERIFVDVTPEHAEEYAKTWVETHWDNGMKDHDFLGPMGKQGAIEHFKQKRLKDPCPVIVTVDYDMAFEFQKKRQAAIREVYPSRFA